MFFLHSKGELNGIGLWAGLFHNEFMAHFVLRLSSYLCIIDSFCGLGLFSTLTYKNQI
jgi:hypothetical protein